MSYRTRTWLTTATVITALVALCWAGWHWTETRCHNKGGHIVTIYKSLICVTDDGRIIETMHPTTQDQP